MEIDGNHHQHSFLEMEIDWHISHHWRPTFNGMKFMTTMMTPPDSVMHHHNGCVSDKLLLSDEKVLTYINIMSELESELSQSANISNNY